MAGNMIGEVDLLGLDEFGQNPGLSPLYGALIGAGVSNLTSIAARSFADAGDWAHDNADAVGFGVGLLASAGMYAMPSTRHAALASAAACALSAGLRALAKVVLGSQAVNGIGDPMIVPTLPVYGPHLGLPTVSNVPQVYGTHGFGEAELQPVPQVYGSGLAGPQLGNQVPVDLIGPKSAMQTGAELLGGPVTSGLASHYGVTLFGGGH